ncbi:metal-sensing transcriptional repressor, partial [Pseudomonas putida]|uniref:metal-sensing transcriptional repressor n=1 Tax=Pseudomonas putida TaxID=303 RepID=UPI00210CA8DB
MKKRQTGRVGAVEAEFFNGLLEHDLEADPTCVAVLQQLAAVRGAINGLMAAVLESHLREEFPDRG